jgi:HSP20 family protein
MNDITTTPAAEPSAPEHFATPPVDVFENDEGFLVVTDLPGVRPDEVQLNFHHGDLTLEAIRTDEGSRTKYRRVLRFEGDVDADHIAADFAHGSLSIRLPKGERARPRQIPIHAG